MRYSDVSAYVLAGLTTRGYGTTGHPVMPVLDPGPATASRLQKQFPGPIVFLTLGGGVGLAHEDVFDMPFIVVRSIGPQHDFATAEAMAHDVDSIMLAAGGNTDVGTVRALYITRTGGSPQLVDFDAGDRYHFQSVYITEVPREI